MLDDDDIDQMSRSQKVTGQDQMRLSSEYAPSGFSKACRLGLGLGLGLALTQP